MFSGRNILIVIVIILLVGLVASVFLSLHTTNKNSSATGANNLNNTSQINQAANSDGTMGPKDSNGNYSANLPKDKIGTLTFSITATNTNTNLKSFVIRVKKIEALSDSGHWETLTMPLPISVDLEALNNLGVANMGLTKLSAESYSEVRIYIDKASVITGDGKKSDLAINNKTGVIRITKDFSIDKGKNTNLTLEFSLNKSYLGNNFDPFIANLLVSH